MANIHYDYYIEKLLLLYERVYTHIYIQTCAHTVNLDTSKRLVK